jgi:hypothetical protein
MNTTVDTTQHTISKAELEHKADAIEMVLSTHDTPGKVTGGHVTPRLVQFSLNLSTKKADRVEALTTEIAAALGVPYATVTRQGGTVRIDVPRSNPQPISLAGMIKRLPVEKIPAYTAVCGLADDGAPLLARLPAAIVGHMLISGQAGSGKTSLVIAMLLSLAYYNKPRHLKIVAVGAGFDGLRGLPHMLNDLGSVKSLLQRPAGDPCDPRVIVAVDEPDADLRSALPMLVDRGAAVGVHCIVASREPIDLPWGVMIKADHKPGDFWAEYEGTGVIRFDAAHANTIEIADLIKGLR